MDELLTYENAADLLGVKKQTVQVWVRQGKIGVVRLSHKAPRISRADLHTFIADRRTEAA
jgi:excisionase family DNA binding protein